MLLAWSAVELSPQFFGPLYISKFSASASETVLTVSGEKTCRFSRHIPCMVERGSTILWRSGGLSHF